MIILQEVLKLKKGKLFPKKCNAFDIDVILNNSTVSYYTDEMHVYTVKVKQNAGYCNYIELDLDSQEIIGFENKEFIIQYSTSKEKVFLLDLDYADEIVKYILSYNNKNKDIELFFRNLNAEKIYNLIIHLSNENLRSNEATALQQFSNRFIRELIKEKD